jgi:hypothetical protein
MQVDPIADDELAEPRPVLRGVRDPAGDVDLSNQ